jgi:hypothetical protein
MSWIRYVERFSFMQACAEKVALGHQPFVSISYMRVTEL